jgi:MFS family permease
MIKHSIGFLLNGLINNYNFIVILSCAYQLSKNNKYINPSLILLFEILPGFLTQLAYPYLLYKIPYKIKIGILYLTQIVSSILFITTTNNIAMFIAISLVSINSYLGESTFLSFSSFYKKKELSFWGIGTGLAGLLGAGFFLLFNLLISAQVIFIINLFLYIFILTLGLYLIDFHTQINPIIEDIKEESLDNITYLEDGQPKAVIRNINGKPELVLIDDPYKEVVYEEKQKTLNEKIEHFFYLLLISSSSWISYFSNYLIGTSYIPLLLPNDKEYQIAQLVRQVGKFIGRTIGNHIKLEKIYLFSILHTYSIFLTIIFTIAIFQHTKFHFLFIQIALFILSFIGGLSYPIVYQYIYNKYENKEREWNLGAVGQFTSFATILASVIGYSIELSI